MITGYNHNIKHNGRIFHIQTEDSGTQYAHIITHLFVGGNIFSSKKCSYGHLLEEDLDEVAFEKAVRAMMQEQHKDMLRELKGGKHDNVQPAYTKSDNLDGVSKVRVRGFHVAPDDDEELEVQAGEPEPAPRAPLFNVDVIQDTPPPVVEESEPKAPTRPSPSRGGARMSRRRTSRARPAFQTPPPNSIELSQSAPKAISSALEAIDLSTLGNLDKMFQDDEIPTVPDLPEVSSSTENNAVPKEPPSNPEGGFSPRGLGRARGIRGRAARSPRPSSERVPSSGLPNPPSARRESSPASQGVDTDDGEKHRADDPVQTAVTASGVEPTPKPNSLLGAWLDVPSTESNESTSHIDNSPQTPSVRVVVTLEKKESVG